VWFTGGFYLIEHATIALLYQPISSVEKLKTESPSFSTPYYVFKIYYKKHRKQNTPTLLKIAAALAKKSFIHFHKTETLFIGRFAI